VAVASKPASTRAPGVRVLTAPRLAKLPWLLHGFSTRLGGVTPAYGGRQLNLARTAEDSQENVERNRERLLRKLRALDGKGNPWPLVVLNQVHSAAIHRVEAKGEAPAAGDGLITKARGVLLAVKVADCLPVIVADPRRKAVGIFHAGWRGTVQRIVEKGVGEMRRQFGCDPADLLAAIGPGIGACCYEIGEQVEDEFDSQFAYSKELFSDVFDSRSLKIKYPMLFLNQRAPGHGEPALERHLDLVEANRRQLLDAGVAEGNIETLGLCTACRSDLFFSYRKEHVTGRMMAVVGIR
jgi:purine-nucleoside/S-methyl-5'-thioadenosine phosphorylase / adenosine deaminase